MIRNVGAPPVATEEEFAFPPWTIKTKKSHILPSKSSTGMCNDNHLAFHQLTLPHLPDMVFLDNILRITHLTKNCGIEFNALDALKLVNDKEDKVKVAVADVWKESR